MRSRPRALLFLSVAFALATGGCGSDSAEGVAARGDSTVAAPPPAGAFSCRSGDAPACAGDTNSGVAELDDLRSAVSDLIAGSSVDVVLAGHGSRLEGPNAVHRLARAAAIAAALAGEPTAAQVAGIAASAAHSTAAPMIDELLRELLGYGVAVVDGRPLPPFMELSDRWTASEALHHALALVAGAVDELESESGRVDQGLLGAILPAI